jgi:type II secretory pathway pseudopilin PulG
MLDVHPPHHAANTWRDFFIHIATIVVGLLIAIGLEQAVEYFHHRHLVHQARENLYEEIETNQKFIRHDIEALATDEAHLKQNIQYLKDHQTSPKQPIHPLNTNWEWYGTSDSAWITAGDTGALALMPYSEVQGYALVYRQQTIVYDAVATYLTLHTQAFALLARDPDLATLSPADIDKLIDANATVVAQTQLVHAFTVGLDRNYANILEKRP